jgi:hypothetical protein
MSITDQIATNAWTRSALATELLNRQTEDVAARMGGLVACEVRLDEGPPVAYCVGFACPTGGYAEVSGAVKACSRALSALLDGSPWAPGQSADHAMPAYDGGYGVKSYLRTRVPITADPDTEGFRELVARGTAADDLQFLRNMSKTPWYPEVEAFALGR